MTDPARIARRVKEEARRLGFELVGIAPPDPSRHLKLLEEWLDLRYHGEMGYLERADSLRRRGEPALTLESVRSVLVVGQEYFQDDPPGVPEDPARGVVARYARGEDYHLVMKDRLEELLSWVEKEVGRPVAGRAYVDTGPILERELGERAGLGWFGKNTMLIHPRRGSYFFLGVLLLDLDLPVDSPFTADFCGSCAACLDACPTGALLGRNGEGAPVMNARRCISYLTIELKGPIPRELRPHVGNRIFGCDICQEVCPWNRKFAAPSAETAYRAHPDTDGPALVDLMGLTEEDFAARFSGSPVKRAKRRGFLRNVAVALGNWGFPDAVPALAAALADAEPLVRGHAAWALGRVGSREAKEAARDRLAAEKNSWVREELSLALSE